MDDKSLVIEPILISGCESGIYRIVNTTTHKMYIGSSVNIKERWRLHKLHLNKKTHRNRYLQNAWNKHGCDAFSFEVICLCSKKDLLLFEQRELDKYKTYDRKNGYNINILATNCLGVKRSKETRKKISEGQIGRVPWNKGLTAETDPRVKSYTDKNKNRTVSEEMKQRISKKLTGYKHTDEAKANISKGQKEKAWKNKERREKAKLRGKDRVPDLQKGLKKYWDKDENRVKRRKESEKRERNNKGQFE